MENLEKDLLLGALKGLRTDVNALRADITDLNKFRWKLVGQCTCFSFVVSVIVGIFIKSFFN